MGVRAYAAFAFGLTNQSTTSGSGEEGGEGQFVLVEVGKDEGCVEKGGRVVVVAELSMSIRGLLEWY
jgi:hypothetical protein